MARRHSPATVLLAVLVAAVPVASGCGGALQPEELRRGVQTIQSTAAEGTILARGASQDRSRSTFTRVHARELADDMTHEAEKLADAEATGTTARAKSAAVVLAQDVASALGDLQVAPGDERGATGLARRLARLRGQAADLAGSL